MLKLLVVLPVIFVSLMVLLSFAYFLFRKGYKITKPNQAFIVVKKGRGTSGKTLSEVAGDLDPEKAIKEGRIDDRGIQVVTSATWVNPITTKVYPFSTAIQTTNFDVDCYDEQKIPLTVRGVLLYKVGENVPAILAAAARFLDFDSKDMDRAIGELVTGQVRAMVGATSAESLITNRQLLTDKVREATSEDMAKLGLQIDSLSIQDLTDDNDYIKNLSAPQAEAVARQASIAADEARKAKAEAKNKADLEISEIERRTRVEQAKFKAEQDRAEQEAAQEGPLARAKAEKQVVQEQTEVAELEAARVEKKLDADVRKVAEADRFAAEQKAQADAFAREKQAEADARAIQSLGAAEAAAIQAKAEAEAVGIEARANALAQNGDLLIEEQLASNMTEIIAAAGSPLAEIDSMVVTDGAEGIGKALMSTVAVAGEAIRTIRGKEAVGATQPSVEQQVIDEVAKAAEPESAAVQAIARYRTETETEASSSETTSENEAEEAPRWPVDVAVINDLADRASDVQDFSDKLEMALKNPQTSQLIEMAVKSLSDNPTRLGKLPALRNVDAETAQAILGVLRKFSS